MDLEWGSEQGNKFVTNVGLITSNGPYGYNIMACEWTHQISYSPGLIMVCIEPEDATASNIKKTKFFGVSLCAADQNIVSSVSGGSTGKEVNKIEALKELGYKFFKAKKIDVMMVEGASMQAECKLIKTINLGDHTLFVGEVAYLYPISGKEPLIYHNRRYIVPGSPVQKPSEEEREKVWKIVEKHVKK